MHSSKEQSEMYLKAIWTITHTNESAKTTRIAERVHVAPSSTTEMLQKLKKRGLINYEGYKGAQLTKKGREIVVRLTRKERLLKKFLHEVLHLPKKKAMEQACTLEHYLNEETERSLCKFMGCPRICRIGNDPIAQCAACMKKYNGQ